MYRSLKASGIEIDFKRTFLYVAGISSTLIIFKFAMFDIVQSSITRARDAQERKAHIEMTEYDARKYRENNVVLSRVHEIVKQEEERIRIEETQQQVMK